MVNKELFTKRLGEILKYYDISASSLADKIGIQRSSVSHLLSGRNNPSLDFILKILDNFPEIEFEWLVKGMGSIDSNNVKSEIKNHTPTLFDEDIVENNQIATEKKMFPRKNESKEIEKILILYTDGSFDLYNP